MYSCTKVLHALDAHQMGRFKNSADGCAWLIPIVRTMRSAGKGVTEIVQESKVPRASVATWIRRNNLRIPPFDWSSPSEESRRAGSCSEVPAKWRPNNPDIISEMDHLAGVGEYGGGQVVLASKAVPADNDVSFLPIHPEHNEQCEI